LILEVVTPLEIYQVPNLLQHGRKCSCCEGQDTKWKR